MRVILKDAICEVTKCYGFKAGDICSIVDCPETELNSKFELETWVEHPVNEGVFVVLYEDEYDLLIPKLDTEIKFTRKQQLQIAKVNRGTCDLQTSLKLELLGFDVVCEKVWCFYSGVFEVLTTLEVKLYKEIGRYYKIICDAPQMNEITRSLPDVVHVKNYPYHYFCNHGFIGYGSREFMSVEIQNHHAPAYAKLWIELKQAGLLEKGVQDA